MMKKACIVGYGGIGPVHARALEKVKNARLYAVCDIDGERRKACKEQYDVVTYEDFDTMLLDEQVDTVHICTPHYLHFPMVKKALAAGKGVVVEKPMAMKKEEFEELLTLPGNERVCVIFQNRYNVCIEAMKRLVESGELGEITSARAIVTWYRSRSYYESGQWRGKWATEGGGVLINQAIHTLDYFNYLTGGVASVKANHYNYSLEDVIEVEDTFVAAMELKNGGKGIFFATNAYAESAPPLFEIAFEKGHARYAEGKLFLNGELIAEDSKPEIGKAYWGNGHEALLRHYYDEGQYFHIEDARNTMETMYAMYKSAADGGRQCMITG